MNVEKFIGFVCGVGIALLIIWAVSRRFTTDGSKKTRYDERQQIIRGNGYKYGLYALFIYIAVLISIECLGLTLPVSNVILYFTGLVVSGFVLAGYCIMHDAYWGINNNIKVFIRFFIGIGLVNFGFGIAEGIKGTLIVDGVLQDSFVNFEAGLLIAGIGIMLLIKKTHDKKKESAH